VNSTTSRRAHPWLAAAFAAWLGFFVSAAQAVIIESSSGAGNTTAPVDDPGFANVGIRGAASGVYVGNRWVLTANHVGGGSIELDGTVYGLQAGSGRRLTNAGAGGRSASTDLYMYRIDADPAGLSALSIASSSPSVGDDLVMVGAGYDRGDFTRWSVNQQTDPWSWSEVSSGGTASGYKADTASRSLRWGTNTVESGGWYGIGSDVYGFITDFDDLNPSNSTQAQAVVGDSGGGVFRKNGTDWELAGIMLAVGGFDGQPNPGENAVFGNVTYIADLSYYAPQINATIATVPEPGSLGLLIAGGVAIAVAGLRGRQLLPR
jgi:hypothetical protein